MSRIQPSRSTHALSRRLLAATSVLALAAVSSPVLAQTQAEPGQVEEVVVTGSLIRGVAPVGTQVSTVSTADIQRSGAISTNQILTNIPQVTTSFNVLPNTPTGLGRSTFRPNIRNLGANGGTTTLVLIDGHNVVGTGILQTTPDAGLLPPGAIERVEVVPDGGSSLYGSDAVGGIINFITRTRFDGIEVSGTVGTADSYFAHSLNITGGWAWSGGSAVISASTRQNDGIYAEDRDRPRQDLRAFGGNDFRVRTCAPGTVIVGATTYALPNRLPGTVNLCDLAINGTVTPKEHQNGVYAAVTQAVTPDIDFEVKGYGSQRLAKNRATQISNASALIDNTNPFFQPIGAETSHLVAFNYSGGLGPYVQNSGEVTQWQVTPMLTWRMGGGWRTRALVDYGWSDTEVHVADINAAAQNAALRGPGLTVQTALNPYDVGRTNRSVLDAISNFENHARSVQSLTTFRVASDGTLFTLPGGEVRAAVGVQHQRQTADAFSVFAPRGVMTGAVRADSKRTVDSVFGEILVPLVGEGNSMPMVRSFEIDVSARHDKYSDFGGTTNPKFGATWQVVEGLRVRGNWGTSFNAPSLADTTGSVDTRVQVFPNTTNVRPGDPASDRNRPYMTLSGGNPGLKPQTADTWSLGVDLNPAQLSGFNASLTLWSVDLENIIGAGVPTGSALLYSIPGYAPFYTLRPTLAQAQAVTRGQIVQGATSVESIYGIGNDPYAIFDLRRQNLASLRVRGLDYRVAYRHELNWGAVYGAVTGSRALRRKQTPVAGAAVVNVLASDVPKSQIQVMAGTDIGQFTATVTVNYTSGFTVVGLPGQTKVKSFAPANLFLNYNVNDGLSLSLNVNNVFDTTAPFANVTNGYHSAIGFPTHGTLGRYYNLAVRKRF